jgi:hypothetical protein
LKCLNFLCISMVRHPFIVLSRLARFSTCKKDFIYLFNLLHSHYFVLYHH